ncbi:hypothetical protein [Nocardia sp. NBC_01327]|uniref:hypothetical protein n=1 Tax=Nocardia sp. NBC_01327 TaxID=2903593 RepID=UPI002E0F1097|nr:hypothetical protein OG326_33025 [Nocardia sp. NBC_01327]
MFKSRQLTFVATALAASAAALLCSAPQASAYVTSVTVTSSGGGKYGTGCSYKVTVTGSANEYIWLYDSATSTFDPQQFALDATGTATSTWTPSSTGTHYVQAWSYNGSQWATIEVGTGTNLGSACLVS